MKQTNLTLFIACILFIGGCASASKMKTQDQVRDDMKDVVLLSILARDYLQKSDGQDFNLKELEKYYTLDRITKNFDRLEEDYRGGHIAILFRFSQNWNIHFEFTERENLLKRTWRIVEKGNLGDWDGEVQFEYGERFYHFRTIVVGN